MLPNVSVCESDLRKLIVVKSSSLVLLDRKYRQVNPFSNSSPQVHLVSTSRSMAAEGVGKGQIKSVSEGEIKRQLKRRQELLD